MPTAVKICGITRAEDAALAARLGAHALGFVFYRPSPRFVEAEQAAAIVDRLPPFVSTVGLFVDAQQHEIEQTIDRVRLDLLQFHGDETPEFCAGFRMPYIKAVRVSAAVDLVQYAARFSAARALLLDAHIEGLHGGTGVAFDWQLIPAQLPLPIVLSGGLTPQNVTQAIRRVRPWAVDVSSGVEAAKGVKDAVKLAAFMQGVRDADL
jgi:phosphoribosylanthranilate isomerase